MTRSDQSHESLNPGNPGPSLAWELWGIFLLALSTLHALALLSYHPRDITVRSPGPSHVHNWIGPTGAMLAEFSLWALGVQAYCAALAVFLVGFRCFWRGELSISPRVVIGSVFFVTSAALLLADGAIPRQAFSYPPGGALGQSLSQFSVGLFSVLGTRIVAATGAIVAFVLLSGWSVSAGLHQGLRPFAWAAACLFGWFRRRADKKVSEGGEGVAPPAVAKPVVDSQPESGSRSLFSSLFHFLSSFPLPFKKSSEKKSAVEPPHAKAADAAPAGHAVAGDDDAACRDAINRVSTATDVLVARGDPFFPTKFPAEYFAGAPSRGSADAQDDREGDQNEPGSRAPINPASQNIQTSKGAQPLEIVKRDAHQGARIVRQAEGQKDGGKPPRGGNKGVLPDKPVAFSLPPLGLLDFVDPQDVPLDEASMRGQAGKLEKTFLDFGIQGAVRQIRPGPVVTMFEFVPAPGVKLSRISALADDIAMAMQALHVRIVAPIPGRGAVGIEIPNEQREVVYLKEIVAHPDYQRQKHKLCVAIGKTVAGQPYFANLADMPHLLIAGTTGSGKSVGVNAMICSILYRATPDQVRFLMIDPKMLELGIYEGIPHLLLPPIIDSTKAARALQWAVREMDRRYLLMNELGVRGIEGYNARIRADVNAARGGSQDRRDAINRVSTAAGDQNAHGAPASPTKGGAAPLPYVVVVVDEYADLVAVAGKDVEACVMRLAQKARACGIHVILATQRPSVDVITGVIKANFPVRIGFRLASAHDSKTIINTLGAEKLLGRGDMLMLPSGSSELTRIHGAFLSDQELKRVVEFWRAQAGPAYDETVAAAVESGEEEEEASGGGDSDRGTGGDPRYQEAVDVARRTGKCSTSWLQRQLGVGYNRAARLVEQLEARGVVGPIRNAKGDREIFRTDATTA
ncbi:MAG: DNA translocase FtsK [Myxococcota bacterium]